MSRDTIDHPHGDSGTQPSDSLNFQEGDFPDPEEFDWFWTSVPAAIDGHAAEFGRLDSNNDGVVDEADYANDADASTYKGRDLDSDGDGVVDRADKADDTDTILGFSPEGVRPSVSDSDTTQHSGPTDLNFGTNLSVSTDGDGTVTVVGSASNDTHVDVYQNANLIANSASYLNFLGAIEVTDDNGGVGITVDDDATSYKNNDLDSDGDGTVDAADEAANVTGSYKGNDIDTDGDGTVDSADWAHELEGYGPNELVKVDGDSMTGDLAFGGSNDIEKPRTVKFATFNTVSDLPGGQPEGTVAYVSSEGDLYVEDGT